MAYLGTTSTAPNVPTLVVQPFVVSSSNVTGVAGLKYGFPRIWSYASTHLATEMGASSTGFFGKDATRLGWQAGDLVFAYCASGGINSFSVITVSTTLAQLSAPTVLGST